MKHLVFTILLVSSFTMSAQKYMKKTASEVTKEYKDATFSGAKSLAENLAESNSFTYVTQILSNEVLLKELAQEEMVTVFVMTDEVFNAMEKEQRETFMSETNLVNNMFKSHSVPGRLDATSIKRAIKKSNGLASFLTLSGRKLVATMNGKDIVLKDAEGNEATIIEANFYHENGFFHVINGMAFTTVPE